MRRRTFAFWVVVGLIAVDTTLFTLVVPALPVFAARDGLSDSDAALTFAAFPVVQLLCAPAAARLTERLGRRPAMIAATVALAAATLAFAGAQGQVALAAARGAQGAAAALTWTAGLAAVADLYPHGEVGFRSALAETAGGAAGLIGPLVGGPLIDAVGTDATFALAALLPALLVGPVLLVPETRRAAGPPPAVLPALRRVLREPKARAAAASLACAAGVLALVEPLLPLDLARRLDLSSTGVGLVFGAGLLAYFMVVPAAGWWADRHGRRPPILLGGALVAVSLPFVAVGPAEAVALGFAVTGAGLALMSGPTGALMAEAVDDARLTARYGISAALLTVVYSAGYSLGPLLGAAARIALPFDATVLIAAGAVALASAWAARALPGEADTAPVAGQSTR